VGRRSKYVASAVLVLQSFANVELNSFQPA